MKLKKLYLFLVTVFLVSGSAIAANDKSSEPLFDSEEQAEGYTNYKAGTEQDTDYLQSNELEESKEEATAHSQEAHKNKDFNVEEKEAAVNNRSETPNKGLVDQDWEEEKTEDTQYTE
ncbi:MAG: hypothetical protein CME62_12265 [Halobacteriovoraceae bacterium]|nr:hypothetical protein [Halobacteriovoraceae bacterium]|tara:strand:- start:353 stop:706 length:354 start_codon:yes stop_codon:yes gene_type:complete